MELIGKQSVSQDDAQQQVNANIELCACVTVALSGFDCVLAVERSVLP